MGPIALECWKNGFTVLGPPTAHYLMPLSMAETALALITPSFVNGTYMPDCRLPAVSMCIEFENRKDLGAVVIEKSNEGEAIISALRPSPTGPVLWVTVAKVVHGKSLSNAEIYKVDGVDDIKLAQMVLGMLSVVHLINMPRLVEHRVPLRADRRRVAAALGAEQPPKWTRVCWTVGERETREDRGNKTDLRMPLHYRCAHWMRAQDGWANAEEVEGRDGLYVWREEAWCGHPDFGINLQVRRPRLPDDAPAPRVKLNTPLHALAAPQMAAAAVEAWTAHRARRGSAGLVTGKAT